ncbi:MAG: hypothetical protein WCF23_01535 [Candidatus Nitrosopolaris sp.]
MNKLSQCFTSLVVLKILDNLKERGRPKIMRKGRLIEKLEEAGIIDHNLSLGAKNKIKGLLNPKFQKQKSRIK